MDGVFLFTIYVLGFEYNRKRRAAQIYESSYWAERKGRARVEQEMRRLTQVHLNTEVGFFVQPIGFIESCYRQCIGTPRQGALVPSSRAMLKLTTNMSPEILDGLDEFTHLWLTFKFHLNTNSLKEARAFYGTPQSNRKFTFKAKIFPPMLKQKKGVFATRSPHRPNPIGVTLARIEKVEKASRAVYLSACDLVDGTPVLDIKPYVSAYDSMPDARVPKWIDETIFTRNTVEVNAVVREQVHSLQSYLKQYFNEPGLFLRAVIETLEADVRSKFQTKKRQQDSARGQECEVPFDNLLVRFLWKEERLFEITQVLVPPPPEVAFDFAENEIESVDMSAVLSLDADGEEVDGSDTEEEPISE